MLLFILKYALIILAEGIYVCATMFTIIASKKDLPIIRDDDGGELPVLRQAILSFVVVTIMTKTAIWYCAPVTDQPTLWTHTFSSFAFAAVIGMAFTTFYLATLGIFSSPGSLLFTLFWVLAVGIGMAALTHYINEVVCWIVFAICIAFSMYESKPFWKTKTA